MRKGIASLLVVGALLGFTLIFAGCAPVGSERWCENMKEKPKGDWSVNEAADFAKHCLL